MTCLCLANQRRHLLGARGRVDADRDLYVVRGEGIQPVQVSVTNLSAPDERQPQLWLSAAGCSIAMAQMRVQCLQTPCCAEHSCWISSSLAALGSVTYSENKLRTARFCSPGRAGARGPPAGGGAGGFNVLTTNARLELQPPHRFVQQLA